MGARGIVRWKTGTPDQQARWLRQYVDCLNYFYFLLSQPPGTEPVQARQRPQAQDAEPSHGEPTFGEPGVGMPGSELDEWSPALSEHQC